MAIDAAELVTVNRRFVLFELVRLKLELDFRRPPSRGPDGGRPVERLSSLRKERPHDCAVKLNVSTGYRHLGVVGHTSRHTVTVSVTFNSRGADLQQTTWSSFGASPPG